MTHEAATFRDEDIISVWSERPRCPITGHWQFVDKAHILGRGYATGAGLRSEDRKIYSSILNFIPLQRDVHKSGYRDHRHMRMMFLEIAEEKVNDAIRNGNYELQKQDLAFLALRREWEAKNFPLAR